MQHYSYRRTRYLFIIAAVLLFISCSDNEGEETEAFSGIDNAQLLSGVYDGEYAGEVYTIDVKGGTFDSNGAYAGENMKVIFDTAVKGRFIIQYTRALIPDAKSEPYYSTDKELSPDVGKWYAVCFCIIKSDCLSISGGWKSGGKNAFDSAEECAAVMTESNGYFTSSSECKKR